MVLLTPTPVSPSLVCKPSPQRLHQVVHLGRMSSEEGIVSQLPWSSASVACGQFREQVAKLAKRGRKRMQMWLPGLDDEDSSQLTPSAVRALGVLYDTVAETDPRMRVIPLLPCAGWTQDSVDALAGPHEVPERTQQPAHPGEHVLLPEVWLNLGTPDQVQLQGASTSVPLSFDHVAVGGTFDRLHCGHELLLSSTALLARKTVYVGITADKLLANKNHRELLQSYEERSTAAVEFMQAVQPQIQVEAGALTDPQEPTQAELDPAMQALVVSQETLPGAVRINQGRVARGFKPLLVLVVPVIGAGVGKDQKLSSTQLRAEDAARCATRQ